MRVRSITLIRFMLLGVCWLPGFTVAEEEALGPEGFPQSWQTNDFAFTMLEPAAGGATVSPLSPSPLSTKPFPISPTSPSPSTPSGPSTAVPQAGGLATVAAPTLAPPSPTGALPKSFRIHEMPRINPTPSGTMAIPTAKGEGLAQEGEGSVFRPIGQALPQHSGGVAADLGIMVNEQALGSKAGGLAALTSYGPLAAGVAAPEGVWNKATLGTQRSRLQAATRQPLASPALREAYRLLLLAQVAAPAPEAGQPHWLAVRAEALEALGLYEAAWSLWREAGPLLRQPGVMGELQQGWARISLLSGQTEAACSLVREQAAAGMVSEFWPSAAAVCAALELQQTGNPAPLTLAIQLLPPKTLQGDPALVAALTAVRDATSPTLGQRGGRAWPIGPLAGATLAAAPALLPAEVIQTLPDVALRRIRASTDLEEGTRRMAALRLVDLTGWAEDANVWLGMVSSPTAPNRVAANWPDAAVLAWAKQVSLSSVVAMPSSTLVGWQDSAPKVVQAALRLGVLETAAAWLPLWPDQGPPSEATQRTKLQTQITYMLLMGLETDTPLQQWLAIPGNTNSQNSQRILAVIEGMGRTISGTTWAAVAGAPAGAQASGDALNLAWQRLLESAAQQRDVPAVLSMVSEALRGQSPASASPAALRASLQALRQVGETQTAARLAAEALTLAPSAPQRAIQARQAPAANGQAIMTIDAPAAPATPTITAPNPPLLPKPNL